MRILPVILAALLLGGCAEIGARWLADSAYLYQVGRDRLVGNHDLRRNLRRLIWESIIRDSERVKEGKPMAEVPYRAMLCKNYPNLVTVDLIKSARKSATDVLVKAPGCANDEEIGPRPALDLQPMTDSAK